MTWKIEIPPAVERQLQKLDRQVQKRVLGFLYNRVLPSGNPRLFGKALTGRWSAYWSYRIGDYRVIADIKDDELVILVVQLDHRRQVYDC